MKSNTCRHVRREIDELDIGQNLGEQTMAHLASCAACAQFRSERVNLRELIGGLKPVAAPEDFDMRLRARLARERAGAERQPFFARFIGMPAIATAAVAVLAVGMIVWIGQGNRDQSNSGVATKQSPVQSVATVNQTPPPSTATSEDLSDSKGLAAAETGKGLSRKPKRPTRSVNSADYGLASANSYRANDSFVNAPSKRVVVSLEDDNGAKRKISLPPVSFGAQSLVDNRIPVNYNGRVW
jgi:hypothetical protein